MNPPSVAPLTIPRSQRISRITKMVQSILRLLCLTATFPNSKRRATRWEGIATEEMGRWGPRGCKLYIRPAARTAREAAPRRVDRTVLDRRAPHVAATSDA